MGTYSSPLMAGNGSLRWRCSKKSSKCCNAFVIMKDNTVIRCQNSHNHWPKTPKNKCPARCSTLNDRLKSVKGEHNHAPTFCQQTMILIDDSSLLFQKNETWITNS